MTSKKQLCMFLSVAVASAVAQAQSPDSGLTLSLDVPGVMVVESVLEGDGVNPLLSEGEALNPPAVVELQPAKIERSVLEFPQIRAMPVATPVGSTPKARLASHGVENAVTATNEAGTESVNEVTGKAELIRQRFPNGKPQIERWVIEDSLGNIVNHGKYVEYDGKGAIVVSGTYSLGKREGEWTKQITDTQVVSLVGRHDKAFAAPFTSRANFKQGKLDGEWTIVDGKGRLVSEWSYSAGARNGMSSLFNAKGDLTQSVNYKENLADGPGRVALANEAAKDTVFTDGMMLRQVDKWYPAVAGKTRVLQSQEWQLVPMPLNIAKSDWEGNSISFQSVGATEPIRHGMIATFYANGQRESEGSYDRGKRTGTFAWWYPNGQQKIVGEYRENAEDSEWTWWHENGMKQASGHYVAGRKVDEWSVWSEQGKLVKRSIGDAGSQVAERETSDSPQIR